MHLTAGTTSKIISASKGEEKLMEVSGKEIVPKEEALNNDGIRPIKNKCTFR